ncbi:MAG: lipid-A-disaccharide synthase [Bacteroidia bacterium]
MKYYIVAGEASGDLHGSNLIKALKQEDAAAEFRFWGGDQMAAEAGPPVKHIEELAFMGFKEVVLNLRTIMRNLRFCKQDILAYKPDVLILIDYPGFNLRLAQFTQKNGIRVCYYISPQVWAWKESRVKKIKRTVGKMLVILPFEEEFYKKHQYEVTFVGHPLVDVVDEFRPDPNFREKNSLTEKPLVALVPGSRKQEISSMLPLMLNAAKEFPAHQFVIAGAPGIRPEFYRQFMEGQDAAIVYGQTYNLFSHASAGCVTSGTATLEAALFKMPEAVCYKGHKLSFWVATKLVKVKYISLVNIIMDKLVVRELIQRDFTLANLRQELDRLLNDDAYRKSMLENYTALQQRLGRGGASAKAAKIIVEWISSD